MLRESTPKRVKVLSIDGGGVRGVIAASIVLAIETELQRRLCDNNARLAQYLDVLAGTSTGSILTALYLIPPNDMPSVQTLLANPSAQFKYSAHDALGVYLEQAPKIFGTSYMNKIWTLGGWDGPIYSPKPLEDMLQQYAGNLMLSELPKTYMAMAYDIDVGEPYVFMGGADAKGDRYFLRDAMRASSAAPTYFPPACITPLDKSPNEAKHFPPACITPLSKSHEAKHSALVANNPNNAKHSVLVANNPNNAKHFVDGGLVANNPSVCTLSKIRSMYDETEIVMISISCGRLRDICPYEKAKNWGTLGWINPIIAIAMDSNSRLADLESAEQLRVSGNYYRFDTPLITASPNLDDCSPKNIAALQADAAAYLVLPEVKKMVADAVTQILL